MKNLFYNKIFIILLVFLFFLLSFNNCYAANYNNYNINISNLPNSIEEYLITTNEYQALNDYYYFVCMTEGNRFFAVFIPKSDLELKSYISNYDGSNSMGIMFNQEFNYKQYHFDINGNYTGTNSNISYISSVWGVSVLNTDNSLNMYWNSNFSLYTDNSYNDTFFLRPPLGITKTLVEETTKVQIMEQLRTTIVGFLKYLIALVVSVIAFWKGWQFLSRQLRKA